MLPYSKSLILTAALAAFLTFATRPAAAHLSPTSLGVPDGYSNSRADDVNNSGQVAGGVAGNYPAPSVAALWLPERAYGQPAGWTILGTLGGVSSEAYLINDAGKVAGVSDTADGFQRGFLWQNGRMKDLGILPGFTSIDVFDMNGAGQIIGECRNESGEPGIEVDGDGDSMPFFWSAGKMRAIVNEAGIPLYISGLNDQGKVIGIAPNGVYPDETYPAVLWQVVRGVPRTTVLTPGLNAYPEAINASGQVVGTIGGREDAFLWLPEAAYGLDPGLHFLSPEIVAALPEHSTNISFGAYALNDAGQIVIYAQYEDPGCNYTSSLLLWDKGDVRILVEGTYFDNRAIINSWGQILVPLYDAPSLFWSARAGEMLEIAGLSTDRYDAFSLNDAGQIAGSAYESVENPAPGEQDFRMVACLWQDPPGLDFGKATVTVRGAVTTITVPVSNLGKAPVTGITLVPISLRDSNGEAVTISNNPNLPRNLRPRQTKILTLKVVNMPPDVTLGIKGSCSLGEFSNLQFLGLV